jgi:hypothetical protein
LAGNSKTDEPAAEVDLGDELLNDDDRAVSNPELLCDETGLCGISDRPKLVPGRFCMSRCRFQHDLYAGEALHPSRNLRQKT